MTEQPWYMARRDSAAWVEAWAALLEEFGDTVCQDPDTGECWQYMGTERSTSGLWTHCFRHRALHGKRVYRHYQASAPETVVFH